MISEILAAMILVATPGYSKLSRVEIGSCDETCVSTVTRLTGEAPKQSFSGYRSKWETPTRSETRIEALTRWITIAAAIESVTSYPPDSWRSKWSRRELAIGLVTIARHESAFWRSIHDGTVRGSAGEWCLAQIHPVLLPWEGVDGPDLVGTDLESTTRCFRVAADLLGRARRLCEHSRPWWPPTIAAYGSGRGCVVTDPWVAARAHTYRRLSGPLGPLPSDAAVLVGLVPYLRDDAEIR